MLPRISVIIPTLNEQHTIGTLLAQLTQLCGQLSDEVELELIVCDGGSKDTTLEVCARYPVILVNSPPGRGLQLNYGAARAGGDFFLFLHADSQVSRESFEQLAKAARNGVRWGCFTLDFVDKSLFFMLLAWCSTLRARLWSSCYGDQGIFCESRLFREVGGFPQIPLMEDVAFSQKARSRGRATVLSARLGTSTRRFLRGGPVHTFCKIQLIKMLFFLGVAPERLATIYNRGEER